MTGTLVNAAGLDWRYRPEPALPAAARHQAIAVAQLVDELTGLPPRVPLRVSTPQGGLVARASAGGLVGLAGRPAALYPDPWPVVSPSVSLLAEADGFLALPLAAELPPQPGFPASFVRQDFGTVALHRRPTRLSGRAVDAAGAAVAGASVAVTGIWTTTDALPDPAAAPNGLSLWPGLYADRPAGATAQRRTLTLLAGPKTLVQPAAAGQTRIRLSDRQSLLLDRPLAIEPGDPERTEYLAAAAIDGSSSADQPAWVTLHHPLARAHPAGIQVVRTAFNAPGAANALTSAGRRGDQSLLTAGLAGLTPANTTIEISGGPAPDEHHGVALWRTVTGPDGRFNLPPIHRVAHLELTASGGGQPQPARRVVSLSGAPEAVADLVFP
ncbi:hypothetical protein SAMN06265365_10645 [Tistlia consotensis]|uniref:Uncharacterized protein n=1 Tax=Tistlia consotensis USBA 355 TaxID=560819 RepID=A0A1Y6BE83_9PROT|nr:hypothetical protein [Tistlia consotensis]SMF02927.1 hypothetical protein SAMN05428998_10396 [Tistlia consotensis USBA 355]SNR53236.1 hypothetical protein SAMN06265365_10645 [Tistlia consotensis]